MFGELRITHSRPMGHTRTPNDQQQLSKYVGTLVKDPKQLAQCSCEGPHIGTMAVQKVMIFCFVFYQHFREISKVAVPNFHNKDISLLPYVEMKFFSRRSQDFLGSVRSV